MECFYDHDPVVDLVALTVVDGNGRQLTTLLDLRELAELAAETVEDLANRDDATLDEVAVIIEGVTGREPVSHG